jgi:hypothetical protein
MSQHRGYGDGRQDRTQDIGRQCGGLASIMDKDRIKLDIVPVTDKLSYIT